ncbi:MAG TPA: LytTR family DNA-binding domain-containing protein [Thermoanaerobaculia bacterium]|jgi:two-component system LytT family response regulator|nr:LytTR family DNA-binding domain-containing protein [Thermoanaerobaculia bacterium]
MIRALIADDERPARRKLRELLCREADFEVVAEAADGVEAVAAIRAAAPDVVFLDIQMPRLDGFGVIAEVGVQAMPLIVFVTAFDEHALRAFEVHALDYLLKPFAPSRLRRLLERLRRQLAPPGEVSGAVAGGDLAQRIERLLAAVRPIPKYPRQLLVDRGEGRQALLAVDQIDLIRAEGNYLRCFAPGAEYRRRGTLRDLEGRLDPARFVRVNRSEIVRLEAIRELQPWFHGDARVILRDGSVLTFSRRYRAKAAGLF